MWIIYNSSLSNDQTNLKVTHTGILEIFVIQEYNLGFGSPMSRSLFYLPAVGRNAKTCWPR